MPVTKLKTVPQELFVGDKGYSSGGICYYMCEYVEEKIWPKGIAYAKALDAAKKAVPATIAKAGKAKNLTQKAGAAHGVAQASYAPLNAPFKSGCLYRIGLWFGNNSEKPLNASDQNHECIVIAGTGSKVLFMDPNWGFYEADQPGTNKEVLESTIRGLYAANKQHAENFLYQKKW